MKTIEEKVISAYIPYKTTLREVSRSVGVDHHRVKRILEANGTSIVKGKIPPFTKEHKERISRACKGRIPWSKGKKMPKESLYKNMATHLRFKVSAEWLKTFEDIEKLKFLNRAVTERGGRFNFTACEYKKYLLKFYGNRQFNSIYKKWIESGGCKWLRPTVDHIHPKAKGGCSSLENLQFLTWFENRAKCDMSQTDWEKVKQNIKDYLI